MEQLEEQGFQRIALLIADRFFNDAPGYVLGDWNLIDEMVRTWKVLSAAIELPEYDRPVGSGEYREIKMAGG